MSRPDLALVLVGFGNVARRFVTLLDELGPRLAFTPRIVAIRTRRHGSAFDPRGLDARAAAQHVESGGVLGASGASGAPGASGVSGTQTADTASLGAMLAACGEVAREGQLVVVETTVLDIVNGQPARDHVSTALRAGAHVVSANKGPAAFAWRALQDEARRAGRHFLCEGAVMDGVPVLNLVRETMPAARVEAFRGIVNTTCAFILSAIEAGQSYESALADMQARGIAEADPSLDVDGWDAAAKAAVLANIWCDAGVTPHDVDRTGITGLDADEVRAHAAAGRHVRLVTSGQRTATGMALRVSPEVLLPGDPLATLSGVENALYITTDVLGEVGIVQRTGTLTQTAYALVSDLSTIAASLGAAAPASRRG